MILDGSDLPSLLKNHFPFFSEPALQDAIADHGQLLHFKAGEIIMDYGSYIKLMPLVIQGSIKVNREDEEDGKELFLYYLTAGDTCSMSFSCCLSHKQSIIRTEAMEDTTIIGIPVQYSETWLTQFQSWRNFVMRSYDNKMVELIRVIDSVTFRNMDTRLKEYLQKKADAMGSQDIVTTHQEIAFDLNASREAVSRLLKRLEQDGQIKLGRNVIHLQF
ncbi:MAG: Crp/Fnr family transcriptional regulator [Bacteroidota bacterium]